jgi:hypothetical protein
MALLPKSGLGCLDFEIPRLHTHGRAPERVISQSQRASLLNMYQTQEMDICALSVLRTCDSSNREDVPMP